jgi:hypothetical protein
MLGETGARGYSAGRSRGLPCEECTGRGRVNNPQIKFSNVPMRASIRLKLQGEANLVPGTRSEWIAR